MEAKRVKEVTVPLSVEEIKEFFVKKDIIYFVDYKNSELNGVVFLTYLSNLDLPAEINFSDCSYQEKAELIKIYMETRNIISCETLRLNVAYILLTKRGCIDNYIINPCFSQDETERFIRENQKIVDRWENFIESTTIFAQSTIEPLVDKLDLENTIEQIDDPSFVGSNVVNMFSISGFYELFLTTKFNHPLRYFKPQFQEYMFRGKNLYSYYSCDENTVYKLFQLHVNGETNMTEINQAGKEAQNLLGK
jgi:hypothetical protein